MSGAFYRYSLPKISNTVLPVAEYGSVIWDRDFVTYNNKVDSSIHHSHVTACSDKSATLGIFTF